MKLGSVILDGLVSNVTVSTQKIHNQKKRALSGKLWQNYASLKKMWTLNFESLTQTNRDLIYNLFASNYSYAFIDHEDNTFPTVQITSESFEDEIAFDYNGNLYYTFSIIVEEE